MTDNADSDEDRLSSIENRLDRLESIFSPNLIDRQTKHIRALENDARDILSVGERAQMKVISPIGDGTSPDTCIGKIHGVVTFVNEVTEPTFKKSEIVDVEITNVTDSAAEATLVE